MASGVPRDVTKLYGSLVCPSSVVMYTELCVLFELRLALSGRIFGIGADKVSMLLNISVNTVISKLYLIIINLKSF